MGLCATNRIPPLLWVLFSCLCGSAYGADDDDGSPSATNIIVGACVCICLVFVVVMYCKPYIQGKRKSAEVESEVHVIQVSTFKNPNAKAAAAWDAEEKPLSAEDIYKESEESAKAHGEKTKEAHEKKKSRLEARLAARRQKG